MVCAFEEAQARKLAESSRKGAKLAKIFCNLIGEFRTHTCPLRTWGFFALVHTPKASAPAPNDGFTKKRILT